MRAFVTGAAGFIGSNLVDRLLAEGHQVVGFDNLSTGRLHFLESAQASGRFSFHQSDLLDGQTLSTAMQGADLVYHLAANADVRFGTLHTQRDLQQNTIGTANVLDAMRSSDVRKIVFASTGSVYGEASIFPTPENPPFPVQTSFYAASKLAAEALIQAHSEAFSLQAYIFRFVSVLGERYTHGHVIDFYKQLRDDPGKLRVLGDGKQKKSYMYVQDCINGIFCALNGPPSRINIFNLGADEYCEVNHSIRWICDELKVNPQIEYTGGERGWVGDNPFIFLDCSRIRALGWQPELTIREAVLRTVRDLRKTVA